MDSYNLVRINTKRTDHKGWSSGIKLSVIPVNVGGSAGQMIPTSAFLDNGSTETFCPINMLEKLMFKTPVPTQLSISPGKWCQDK